MKRSLLIIWICCAMECLSYSQSNTLTGHIYYFPNKIMHDSVEILLYQGQNLVYSTTVNAEGSYLFQDIPAGNYTLTTTCTKKWGGGNSLDALMIAKHFVQMIQLTGIQLKAADVNGSGGTPGNPDALAVLRRFSGAIPSFIYPWTNPGRPDWTSESFNIVIDATGDTVQDIRLLCTGDINGSYNPL